jgi:hypothetical protein
MRSTFLAVALVAVLLAACATGERMRGVQAGMWKDELVGLLGEPDGVQRIGEYEVLRYSNRLASSWSSDRADYSVILRGGRVVESGPGQVRPLDPGAGMPRIVPPR